MTPDEIASHLTDATGAIERSEVAHGEVSVWVPNDKWVEVATHLRDCGRCHFDFPTFLTAVDMEEQGFEIVLHMYSVRRQHHVPMQRLPQLIQQRRPINNLRPRLHILVLH